MIILQPFTVLLTIVPTPTAPIFVYEETWLHRLVPEHAYCYSESCLRLNLSLDECECESNQHENSYSKPTPNHVTCPQIHDQEDSSTTVDHVNENIDTSTCTFTSQPTITFSHDTNSTSSSPITNQSNRSITTDEQSPSTIQSTLLHFDKSLIPGFNTAKEREIWKQFYNSTSKRGRGHRSFYKVEFNENIFSKIYNGKVRKHHNGIIKDKKNQLKNH